MAVNDEILSAEIRHSIGLHRLATGIIGRMISLLDSYDGAIYDAVRRRDPYGTTGKWSYNRIRLLLEDVKSINLAVYVQVNRLLAADLRDLAVYEANFQGGIFKSIIPVTFRFRMPSQEQLHAAAIDNPFEGALLSEWVAGMEQGRFTRLRNAIRISFASGETLDDMIRRIRGRRETKFRDGILDISRRSAETIGRTAVMHTATAARQLTFDANSELIKGLQWVSTLDMRTTPVCRARDGKVYKIEDFPPQPAHLNCRSTSTPIIKSWKEMGIDLDEAPEGTRASMDGQVPASMTYEEWLRKQTVDVQNEVMGVAKATLFRKGGLSMEKFVDSTGRAYTLPELRRLESEAWQKAGLAA